MKDKIYYVYEWFIINTGEVFYVGKGKNKRAWQLKDNMFFMKMYNTHVCDVRIVFNKLKEEEAFEKEIELIKYYREKTNFRLTNVADGGNQPPIHYGDDSPTKRIDVRNKISQSLKKAYKNPKLRENISIKQIEYLKSEWGQKEKSERSRKSMSNINTRKKIKQSNIETWRKEELKMRQSAIMKSCFNHDKALKARRKNIVQLTLDNNFISTYSSLIEAENLTNIKFKNISKVLRGTNMSAGGYKWQYLDEFMQQNGYTDISQIPNVIIHNDEQLAS